MTTLLIDAQFPGGKPLAKQFVRIQLVAGRGGGSTETTVIGSSRLTQLDGDGHAEIEIVPNDTLSPENTYYYLYVERADPNIERYIQILSDTPDNISWAASSIQVNPDTLPDLTATINAAQVHVDSATAPWLEESESPPTAQTVAAYISSIDSFLHGVTLNEVALDGRIDDILAQSAHIALAIVLDGAALSNGSFSGLSLFDINGNEIYSNLSRLSLESRKVLVPSGEHAGIWTVTPSGPCTYSSDQPVLGTTIAILYGVTRDDSPQHGPLPSVGENLGPCILVASEALDETPLYLPASATSQDSGGTTVHNDLTGRDAAEAHPSSAIDVGGTSLDEILDELATLTDLDTAIDAEASSRTSAIGAAISTEATNRNTAVGSAISTEVTNRNLAIGTAVASEASARTAAINTEVTDRDTAVSSAVATEATNRNSAIATAVSTEVTNRNSAISSHGSQEATDRNAAIATAVGVVTAKIGAPSGIAELDSSGLVPAAQLPSYVNDVLEYANFAALPGTGESGKIYVTLDTNLTYRWSGSAYVEISSSLALGETSATAYRGDRGKTAYDFSQSHPGASDPHGDRAFATAAVSALSTVYQPLDADLTALAALTTDAFGRILLTKTDSAAIRSYIGLVLGTDVQPYNAGLAAIAAIATDAYGRALLTKTDAGSVRTYLGLGSLATASTITSSDITDGTIVDADISGSAAIAMSKIYGLSTALSGKLDLSTATTKGDTFAATGASTVVRVGAGADGTMLTANSNSSPGLMYVPPPRTHFIVSGQYTWSHPSNATATMSTSGRQYYLPIYVWRRTAFTRLALIHSSGNSTLGGIRVSIYGSDVDGMPGSRIIDGGTIDTTTGTGVKYVSINTTLDTGMYYLACAAQGVTGTNPILTSGAPYIAMPGSDNVANGFKFEASVTGTPPTTATPGPTNVTNAPVMGLMP